jgi:predicted transcriptional regulator
VRVDEDLDSALQKLAGASVTNAVVLSAEGAPLGVISREDILEAWRRATEPPS